MTQYALNISLNDTYTHDDALLVLQQLYCKVIINIYEAFNEDTNQINFKNMALTAEIIFRIYLNCQISIFEDKHDTYNDVIEEFMSNLEEANLVEGVDINRDRSGDH